MPLQATPNPSTSEVHLQWPQQAAGATAVITVSDEAGRQLKYYGVSATSGEFTLKTTDYPAGTYFITLHIGTHGATTQLLVR